MKFWKLYQKSKIGYSLLADFSFRAGKYININLVEEKRCTVGLFEILFAENDMRLVAKIKISPDTKGSMLC